MAELKRDERLKNHGGPAWKSSDVVGLIPAAGVATRLSPLPCSKEILPIGLRSVDGQTSRRPKVACEYLLSSMQLAGARQVYIVLRDGKWDIPAYLRDGRDSGLSIAYLMMRLPFGVPFTLDQAYEFIQGRRVICGFPDILIEPEDAFSPLLDRMSETQADVVLALFPAEDPQLMDQVEVDGDGNVRFVQVKPGPRKLDCGWAAVAWAPAFTELLHDYVARASEAIERHGALEREPHLGDVVQAAVEAGLRVQSVWYPEGAFLDIGTPANLVRAWSQALDAELTVEALPQGDLPE